MPDWIVGLLIASGLAAGAIALIVRTYKWRKNAVAVEGEIVEFGSLGSGTGSTLAPVIEFSTREGETIRFKNNTKTMFDSFSVGDRLPVVYEPGNPERAKIDRIGHLYSLPILIGIVAIAAAGVALSKNPDIIAHFRDGQ